MHVKQPIILLGFHRSGTSMLGRIFSQHPDVAYWIEPRHVWMHHFMYQRFDVLGEAQATPRVINRIQSEFARFLNESGNKRFVEKTPSNMVRLLFIKEVMPDAKVVHIIRDGRASTLSTVNVLKRPARGNFIRQRAKSTPWWHYPAYIPKAWRTIVRPRLPGSSIPFWGPRIPNLRQQARKLSLEELCAWQWQESLNIAREDAKALSADQYREWRYEDLVTDPVPVVKEMFAFTDLPWTDEIESYLKESIHSRSLDKWKQEFTQQQIAGILPHLEPLLSKLGYITPTDQLVSQENSGSGQ